MAKISVILLEDIPELGAAGDIVSVVEGYARNALFPEGKAALATEAAQQEQRTKQSREAKKSAAELEKLQDQAAALDGTELVIEAQVKDGTEIFGSVTAAAIAKELQQQANVDVKAKDLDLDTAITEVGSYDVTVDLGSEVEATIKVTIVPAPGSSNSTSDDE